MYEIIKKVIDELNSENFRRDYCLGMLETLYGIRHTEQAKDSPVVSHEVIKPPSTPSNRDMTEAEILDAKAKIALEKMQKVQ